MIDTGTVRLVIFFVMFVIFAGDYNAVISKIFGKEIETNNTELVKGTKEVHENFNDQRPVLQENAIISAEDSVITRREKMIAIIKTACLPKLICELTSIAHQDQLTEMERALLNFIRDTSLSSMAEVASKYHFAAHMGQLISGIEGQGCHNFYPTCPFPSTSVLNMMKKIRLR